MSEQATDRDESHSSSTSDFYYSPVRTVVVFVLVVICIVISNIQCLLFIRALLHSKNRQLKNRWIKVPAIVVFTFSAIGSILFFFKQVFFRVYPIQYFVVDFQSYCAIITHAWIFCTTFLIFLVLFYFSVRIEQSFKGSVFAYPPKNLIIFRALCVIAVILTSVFNVLVLDVSPTNSRTSQTKNVRHPNSCAIYPITAENTDNYYAYLGIYIITIVALILSNIWILAVFLSRLWAIVRDQHNRQTMEVKRQTSLRSTRKRTSSAVRRRSSVSTQQISLSILDTNINISTNNSSASPKKESDPEFHLHIQIPSTIDEQTETVSANAGADATNIAEYHSPSPSPMSITPAPNSVGMTGGNANAHAHAHAHANANRKLGAHAYAVAAAHSERHRGSESMHTTIVYEADTVVNATSASTSKPAHNHDRRQPLPTTTQSQPQSPQPQQQRPRRFSDSSSMYRAESLRKQSTLTRTETTLGANEMRMIEVMKKQSFLVCCAILSTLLLWILATLVISGVVFQLDATITALCVFLSFEMNSAYYLCLKCDKCSRFCCKIMDYCIERRLIHHSLTIGEIEF